jgi:nucleoid DNA-binding protein
MEENILSDKLVITKENLINIMLNKCKDDFISIKDLIKIIDEATDEHDIISKRKLIKSIENSHTKTVIKDIYNILENSLFESLSLTNEKQNVNIKLFEGISLSGSYASEKIKKNNLTGEINLVPSRIKPKFSITRTYCEKLNSK